METNSQEPTDRLEDRSRSLWRASVDGLDYATRSRLTQARHAAVEASADAASGSRFVRLPAWRPMIGLATAGLLGLALWFGPLSGKQGMSAEYPTNFDDLDIVAASDVTAGDPIEMLQDDIDFYDFANKVSNADPAA